MVWLVIANERRAQQFCEQFQPDDKMEGIEPTLFNIYILNQSQAEFAGATSGFLQCLGGKLISKVQLPDVWKVKKCKVNVSVRDRLQVTKHVCGDFVM